MDSLTGQFLIASPSILDPNFRRTVVFVTAHTEEGAIGLILNRRSEATVGDAGVVVIEDIGFVALDDALEEGAPPDLERTRVFAGVAGWGPEQLEEELERDDWIVESADLDDIFTDDPDGLWSAILRRKGGQYELVARMPVDPSLN